MTATQKVIKYLAMALAISIIFSIASAAMGGIAIVADIISSEEIELKQTGSLLEGNITQKVSSVDIDVYSLNVWIKEGNSFTFETNNESVQSKVTNGKLTITQKEPNFIDRDGNSSLIIYVPESADIEKFDLDSAAGNVIVEDISVQKLNLSVAAGELQLKSSVASKSANIDGGLGKVDIQNCKLTDLDLDMGIGKLVLLSALYGKSDIDCGIGQAVITLKGSKDNYKIKADHGIGSLRIDSNSIAGETTYGDGKNVVDIDAGIGMVTVDFYKKSK